MIATNASALVAIAVTPGAINAETSRKLIICSFVGTLLAMMIAGAIQPRDTNAIQHGLENRATIWLKRASVILYNTSLVMSIIALVLLRVVKDSEAPQGK